MGARDRGLGRRVAALLLGAASGIGVAGPADTAVAQERPPPGLPRPLSSRVKELVAKWFAALPDERAAIVAQLGAADWISTKEAKSWAAPLIERARAGPRLEASGTHAFEFSATIDGAERRLSGEYLIDSDPDPRQCVICLHGGGEGSGAAEDAREAFHDDLAALERTVVIYPEVLRKTECGWTEPETEQFVFALIAAARRTWPLDGDRLFLTGFSMGGFGTWMLGARQPDLFAAGATYAGGITPLIDGRDRTTVLSITPRVLPNLFHLPLFIYQSGDDPNVPPGANDFAVRQLGELRAAAVAAGWPAAYTHHYDRVEGRGHGNPANGLEQGLDWALARTRDPRPRRIVWEPVRPWQRWMYWTRCDGAPTTGRLEAEVTAKNEITLTGPWPEGATSLFLDERLCDLGKPITVWLGGRVRFEGKVGLRLSTLMQCAAERIDPACLFPARIDL